MLLCAQEKFPRVYYLLSRLNRLMSFKTKVSIVPTLPWLLRDQNWFLHGMGGKLSFFIPLLPFKYWEEEMIESAI